jgi:hypothetical protein
MARGYYVSKPAVIPGLNPVARESAKDCALKIEKTAMKREERFVGFGAMDPPHAKAVFQQADPGPDFQAATRKVAR